MAEGLGPRFSVRFGLYSWALLRFGQLPIVQGDAWRHGSFHGILMESGNSVADHERV